MTSTILVPVDGSDKDARALAVAADLAQVADASVLVVRVHNPQAESAPHESRSSLLQAMRATAEVLGLRVPRGLTCEVLDGDDVPNALLGRADSVNATALVMATRAPQAIDRAIHGSVADHVVRAGTRPVVLVPPRADYMGGRDVRLRRGLVPVDGSATALSVIAHLLAFPNARELDLLLLQVVPPEPNHEAAEKSEQALTAVVERVRERGVTAEARVVEARHPAVVIVGAIRQDLIDFIAMSTRGAGGIARTMLGSVATTRGAIERGASSSRHPKCPDSVGARESHLISDRARLAVLEGHGEVSRDDAASQFRALCTKLAYLCRLHREPPRATY